jgi:hypothetical protein
MRFSTLSSSTGLLFIIVTFLQSIPSSDGFQPLCAPTKVPANIMRQQEQQQHQLTFLCQRRGMLPRLKTSDRNEQPPQQQDTSTSAPTSSITQLTKLGFTETEIKQSRKMGSRNEPIKVRVDIVDNVDPVTLTAIGFALIALNFLVFANMGDGGIAGIVATIINSS